MILSMPEKFQGTEKPFVIADLGTADSKNSLPLFRALIGEVYQVNDKLPIVLYLNDLPTRDLTHSADNVQKYLKEVFGKDKTVFIYTVPGSFHGRLFPPQSIDIFMSNLALYWLKPIEEEEEED